MPRDNSHLPPVMILGCGRSGTSILGELFNYIGNYDYASEPPFSDVIGKALSDRPRAFKVPRESAGHEADAGLSFPLPALVEALPDIRIVWIVRHPLDAVASLRVGIAQDWGHHPRPPDWRAWLERPLIERCAHHWTHINSHGYRQVRGRAVLVRFEDMIADAESFATGLCRALDMDPGTLQHSIPDWAGRVQNENNERFVEAETSRPYSRPDHAVRVGRWQENLSPDDIARSVPIVAEAAVSFGYRLPDL